MEKNSYEHPKNMATFLMTHDYLNEYISIIDALLNLSNIQEYKPRSPKSFSERYPNMTFSDVSFPVSEADRLKIQELDTLSVQAKHLLEEEHLNTEALTGVVFKVTTICERPDIANKFKNNPPVSEIKS